MANTVTANLVFPGLFFINKLGKHEEEGGTQLADKPNKFCANNMLLNTSCVVYLKIRKYCLLA